MIPSDPGHLVFAVSAALDSAIALAAVVWTTRGERLLARALIAGTVATVALVVKGAALVAAGLNVPFGVMHVVWLELVVVLPLAGALALVLLRGRRGAWPARVAALAVCLLAPVGAYASLIEPGRLVLERPTIDLPPERAGSQPLRVGVLADLQFDDLGDHEREAVARLLAERPDLILLAGDYHQGSSAHFERALPGMRRLFASLEAPGGVYAVFGDTEDAFEANIVLGGTGVRLLVNELVRARVRGRDVTVAGLERDWWSLAAGTATSELESAPGDGDVRILLSHRPDAVYSLEPRSRVDLVVAGHTHGGQVQLPFVGPPSIASRVPREVAAGGLHELDGRRLYVSRGVGVERGQAPRIRLGAPPEVAVLTLR